MDNSLFKLVALNASEATLYLYGDVGSWAEINVKDFTDLFNKAAKKYKKLHLRINSGGGEVFEGFAIYNLIKSAKVEVHTYNDGIAASMASILLMAGTKIHMSKNAMLMIHQPSGGQMGTAEEMREYADMMDKIGAKLFQVYADRTGKDMDWIKNNWMDGKDHWMDADEALEAGLIDTIYDNEVTKAEDNSVFKMVAHYSKELNKSLNKPITMKKLIAKINKLGIPGLVLDAAASDEEITAALEKIESHQASLMAAKDDEIAQLTADRDKFKETAEAAEGNALKNMAVALIDGAKASNKIVEKEAEHLLTLAQSSPEAYESVKQLIDGKKAYKPVAGQLIPEGGDKSTKELAAEWDKLHAEDGLADLKLNDKEKYVQLFTAKYGKAPQAD